MSKLEEISKLVLESRENPQVLLDNADDILKFIGEIDLAGATLLKARSADYDRFFMAMVKSCALLGMVLRGDISPMESFTLSSSPKDIALHMMIVKMTLGLAALEELR